MEYFARYQQRYILDTFYIYFILRIHVVGVKKINNDFEILLRRSGHWPLINFIIMTKLGFMKSAITSTKTAIFVLSK